MYCEQCQSEFPEARKFCPQCGAHLKTLISPVMDDTACPSCGTTIQLSKKSCIYCGYRISEEPRQCPTCIAAVPAGAAFCGECGTDIITRTQIDQTILPGTKIDVTPFVQLLESDPFEAGNQSAKEEIIFLDSVSREEIINGKGGNQSAEEEERFFDWLRKPVLQISIMISLLPLVAIFSYRLGSQRPDVGDEPLPPLPSSSSLEALTQSPVMGKTKGATVPTPPQEDGHIITETSSAPKANSKKANGFVVSKTKGATVPTPPQEDGRVTAKASSASKANGKKANASLASETKGATVPTSPQGDGRVAAKASNASKAKSKKANDPAVTEQPLIPPRLYRVTTPTVLRDQPKRTGKKIVQLQSGIKITVIAITGDWLKVVSRANPPKPPGYIWKKNATPEG